MSKTLITCYVNPDLDGVAGAMAYAEYLNSKGQPVEVGVFGEIHDEAKFVLDKFNIPYPLQVNDTGEYDSVILVDASDLIGLEGNVPPEKVVEIIDHRAVNEAEKFINAKIQIEMVGAAATLIAEKFIQDQISISKNSAHLLYCAIVSNTLNFHSSNYTERDVAVAKWADKIAPADSSLISELFAAKSDLSGARLGERIRGDFAWFGFGDIKFGIAQIEVVGAEKLILERQSVIAETLKALKKELDLNHIFLTAN